MKLKTVGVFIVLKIAEVIAGLALIVGLTYLGIGANYALSTIFDSPVFEIDNFIDYFPLFMLGVFTIALSFMICVALNAVILQNIKWAKKISGEK